MLNRDVAREIVSSLALSHPSDVQLLHLADGLGRESDHALEWLDHSGLALQFWSRMLDSGIADQIPHELAKRLSRNLADHRKRVHAMLREFSLINACFASAGIPYAVLKGFALFPNYFNDICLRTAYDFDYIVAADEKGSADAALRAGGYIRKKSRVPHPLVYFDPVCPLRSPSSRDEIYQPGFPRTIELHLTLWHHDELRIPLPLPADFVARRELRWLPVQSEFSDVAPLQYYALRDTDELIFQVLHIFRHILHNWCRISSLFDIACFLERRFSDSVFWSRFIERIAPINRFSEITGLVLLLASETFGVKIPAEIAERVVMPLRPPIRLWVERYGREAALTNFSADKFALFLHREFVDNAAAWRTIQRTRLIPLHRPNHAVRSTSQTHRDRLRGALKQGLYVAQRLKHHSYSSLRYGLEIAFWARARYQCLRLDR